MVSSAEIARIHHHLEEIRNCMYLKKTSWWVRKRNLIEQERQIDGGGMMAWTAVNYTDKSNIKFVSNKMNSKIYIQRIQELLIKYVCQMAVENVIFQITTIQAKYVKFGNRRYWSIIMVRQIVGSEDYEKLRETKMVLHAINRYIKISIYFAKKYSVSYSFVALFFIEKSAIVSNLYLNWNYYKYFYRNISIYWSSSIVVP